MMLRSCSSSAFTARLSAAFRERAARACPDEQVRAVALLRRLPPEQWTLEWMLPLWLGGALGLADETSFDLCLANLLGLGAVRLRDDLADGEIARDEWDAMGRLAAALHTAALDTYRAAVLASSWFWDRLDAELAAWRTAMTARPRLRARPGDGAVPAFRLSDATVRRLARRAAPLKIGAFAVLALTDRADLRPIVEACLDHALGALVLYDDAADWQADLAAGRWNAFVAACASQPQVPRNAEANRAAVHTARSTTAARDYMARIQAEAAAGAALADVLACAPLSSHLRSFARQADLDARRLERHHRRYERRAAALMFGDAI